ncbi:MAG: elongation factor 1-beta [Methanobacteriota archaeon]
MGDVLIFFQAAPEGLETDLGKMRAGLEAVAKKHGRLPGPIEQKPLAFGLEALIVKVIIPDKAGLMDKLEAELRAVEGVSNVETLDMSLI